MFLGERRKAWAPCYSVDLVSVLRHTVRARRAEIRRDTANTALLAAGAVAIAVICWLSGGASGLAGAALGALGYLILLGRPHRQRAARQMLMSAVGRRLRRNLTSTVVQVLLLVLLVAVFGAKIVSSPTVRACAAVVLAVLVSTWLVTVTSMARAFLRASAVVRSKTPIRGLAPELAAATEQRATEVSAADTIIYTRPRASSPLGPFVGGGHRLMSWTTPPVNVTIGLVGPDRQRRDPKPIDIVGLHDHLKATAESLGVPRMVCQHRLYVDGKSVQKAPKLLSNGIYGPPRHLISDDAVRSWLYEHTPHQRTYLCLEVTDWGGDVVVTMYVRAVLEAELLQLEISLHALPEVDISRTGGYVQIPEQRLDATRTGLRLGAKRYRKILSASPKTWFLYTIDPMVLAHRDWKHRQYIKRRRSFDFGAEKSLREHLAKDQTIYYNAVVDQMGHADRLQHRLVAAFAEYLTDRDVDIRDFVRRSESTILEIQQTVIREVRGNAIVFGAHSTVVGGVPAAPQAAPTTART